MMRVGFRNERGFTVLGATVAAAVVAATAVTSGILIAYVTRAKLRAEAKASVIDNESSLSEVVAATLIKTLSPPSTPGTLLTPQNFVSQFNAQLVNFPDNTVTLSVVQASNKITPPTGHPQWFKEAADSCNLAPQAPVNNTAPGVYLFCVRLNRTNTAAIKTSVSFLDSELAFAQFRVELSSQSLPHQQKVFGISSGGTTVPAVAFANWGPRDQQQLKISYRIFWKRKADAQGYYQYMGSKVLNVAETRI